jgi:hypothetical protein
MLWWRFCPFCGTHLPTVLDGKVEGDPQGRCSTGRSKAARKADRAIVTLAGKESDRG